MQSQYVQSINPSGIIISAAQFLKIFDILLFCKVASGLIHETAQPSNQSLAVVDHFYKLLPEHKNQV